VIPFGGYQLYQAERAVTERERRLADVHAGELAAAIGEVHRSFIGRAKALVSFVRRAPRFMTTALARS
jgi:hypothetical protein